MNKLLDRMKTTEVLRYIMATIGELDVQDDDNGIPCVATEWRSVPIDVICAKKHLCMDQNQLKELHYTLFEQLGWLAPALEHLQSISVHMFLVLMHEEGCFE